MIKLKLALELNYHIAHPGCDFIFNVHAARTRCQAVLTEHLSLSQALPSNIYRAPESGNRYLRVRASGGPLKIQYAATVALSHFMIAPAQLSEVPIAQLPDAALQYIYPSRYCQSDRLHKFAMREFGHLWQGYSRVQAIQDWVRNRVTFKPGASNASTSAMDTLVDQVGVCRDYAHLMIALCRAVNIPARFATGIDYGADIALGPTDFHAYVEVYLGNRWYIFDPSGTAMPMGFVRFGTGRDAADTAFATLFGTVNSTPPIIQIEAIVDTVNECFLPYHCAEALSTDDGV